MDKKINKIGGIVVGICLVVGIFVIFYKKHQFMQSYNFTIGKITTVTIPGWKSSGDYSILYEYKIQGKEYFNNENYTFCDRLTMTKVRSLLLNKTFPVAYSINDASVCSMVITIENSKRFNYKISDSLLVYDSILTCK